MIFDTPNQRRLYTPPAAAASWPVGAALDSGTAQILDSNLAWQCRESLHHLGTALGPGVIAQGDVSGQLLDAAETVLAGTLRAATWSRLDSVMFGPYDITPDTRALRVVVDADAATAASLQLVAVVNDGPGRPIDDSRVLALYATRAPAGRSLVTLPLSIRVPPQTTLRRARADRAVHAQQTDCWVWCAWRGDASTNAVIAISAYEVRP